MQISEKTRKWLLDKYQDAYEDFCDSHYWEEEHDAAAEKMEIFGEIINALKLK